MLKLTPLIASVCQTIAAVNYKLALRIRLPLIPAAPAADKNLQTSWIGSHFFI